MSSDVEVPIAPSAIPADPPPNPSESAAAAPAEMLADLQQKMPGQSKDSRSTERVRVRLRAVLITEKNGAAVKSHGYTADISGTGVSFVTQYALTDRQSGTIYIMVDPGDATHSPCIFEAQCRLIICVLAPQQGGFRIGIAFSKMSDESSKTLKKLLKDKQPSYGNS